MKHDLKALRDLEKRLAEATGPSNEIDWDIDEMFGDGATVAVVTPYTRSLDAAIALVERVMPHEWGVERLNDYCHADIWYFTPERYFDTTANAPSPALALCLACVRALIAQGEVTP